ncbi:retrovirus-related pol polyprotein from transposon TNT 1-94 [Tanacetum coccineum]|uniref:Retrovirus-related pol polyprotein from transposon TNT 1-94 n=1 Tax=Tanacetum coccineum TaxID=301880 RepID=A0ABQ5FB26_9ASTR
MAQQQHAADVHPDELCPPNKRYDLMDANKKVDLEHVQCPPESKILTNIIKNHPLRFSIAASSSVPWIYMAQFWHTLKEDGSKYRLKFMLDKKELTLTLDDFRTIFHLPQATDNNHNSFVPPPSFSDMVPFYKQVLGFTMELKTSSSFKTTGLLQPWQTLCKIFSKCLTTRVTGWDQPPLQIMQMMYCFVNNIHVDYAELLWEGLYYSLHHPTSSIPYPRFTKIIVSHYMTIFPDISRRARDKYHNLQDDDIMKNIFNSGRHKDKVGMQIPAWMITEEMKHTEHYRMYAEVFGIDVPLTQSQPTESTQGTHRTPSAPRSPNPNKEAAESSALRRSTVIRLRIPERRSTLLTPPAPVLNVDKADEMILQDTLQVSLAEHKSREEQEARENMALIDEHLAYEEIEKMVDGQENVVDDSSIPRNDESNIPGTKIEPRSNKESPEVEITKYKEVEITKETLVVDITNIVIPVNTKPTRFKRYKSFFQELQGCYGYLFAHLRARFMPRKSFDTLTDNLHDVMVETLPTMVDKHIKEQVMKQVPEQVPVYVAEGLILERQKAKKETERLIAKAILQECGNIQAQISTQIENAIANVILSQVDASVRSYMIRIMNYADAHPEGENSAIKAAEDIGSKIDDYDFLTDLYASDDDEIQQSKYHKSLWKKIEDHEMFSIIYEPVHGFIYKNRKKEKRVMRHSEIHKFCDAMLNRVLEEDDEDVGVEADINNLDTFMHVSPIPTTRIHKDHPVEHYWRLNSAPQQEDMTKNLERTVKKYVTDILKKFSFTDVKTASTPMETQKLLLKDEDGEEVDVHLYRSMIGSLMYLIFRPGYYWDNIVRLKMLYVFLWILLSLSTFLRIISLNLAPFSLPKGPDTAYLLLYVDDIILTASFTSLMQRIISSLHVEFAMTDLGPLNYFLGIFATRTTAGIFLSQTKYATEILERAQMLNYNPCRTLVDTKKNLGPEGSSVTNPTLYRSLARALHLLPTLMLTGQDTLSRSSDKAGYRGVANAVAETSWIHNLLRELHTPLFTATLVYCDNIIAVYMSANPMQHQRTKYIEIDIHFVRNKVAAGHV